jgi:hypothetical protein
MLFFGNVDLLASYPHYVANVQVVAENKIFNELKLSELLNSVRSD